MTDEAICCPEFIAEPWTDKVHEWNNKLFIKDKVFTLQYMWYTTCPKCAKKYGKNYVVILGQIA